MRYLIYLILVVPTLLHAGAIHKWVDESGNVHYGDAPPTATKTENVNVQSAPSNPGKALPRLSTEQADDDTGAGGGDTNGQENVSEDRAKAICESARNDLNILNTNTRIQLKQADGVSRYLSADEIEQRKARSQSEIDRFCN
jgi:hypothetical protein